MANVIFIGEDYIKKTSYIDENVDVKLLRNSILETQDFRIEPIVGTGLYNELKDQVDSGTKTALNNTLLNTYLAPALKYWVLIDASLILNYKIMNKSIVKRTSDNTEQLDLSELDRLMNHFKIRAEFYSEKATKYLIENEASYPLYNDAGDGFDTVHPYRNNYTQGLYLGQKRTYKGNNIDYGRDNYC